LKAMVEEANPIAAVDATGDVPSDGQSLARAA
jgi:hypothetical protein